MYNEEIRRTFILCSLDRKSRPDPKPLDKLLRKLSI